MQGEQITSHSFVTMEDVIESMSFGPSDGDCVQGSNLTDKTAEIAMKYGERMKRANRQIDHRKGRIFGRLYRDRKNRPFPVAKSTNSPEIFVKMCASQSRGLPVRMIK